MTPVLRIAITVTILLIATTAGPLAAQEASGDETPAEITAVVATGRLNVRDTPVYLLGRIVTQIDRGESYPVVGRNLEGTWAQLDVDGILGWVNARHIVAAGLQEAPFSASAAAVGIVNARVQTGRLNVRDFPHHEFGFVLTRVYNNTIWPVTGRNADSTWAQVDINGTSGWVNARYLLVPDLMVAPAVDTDLSDLPVNARVDTGRLNVRNIPNFFGGEVVTKLWRGEVYPVLARNFDGSWAQLDIDGEPGWVNASYIEAPRLELAPLSVDAQAAQDMIFARVNTGRLNARDIPDLLGSVVVTRLWRGEIHPVAGRDLGSDWAQLDIDGTTAWVRAALIQTSPDLEFAPLSVEAQAAHEMIFARVDVSRLNVRARPVYPDGEILTQLSRDQVVTVLGRDANSNWIKIDYDHRGEGATGWVNGRYLYIPRRNEVTVTLYG
ncbi:MAG: SH3 domain-containing protein [Anaerolineaceae bacterium]|nr:SH3 domain-containing protein [Anaerolineaceae bacterium]MDE0327744.1 SH3 domain-containing protein [Anaerolineaceae bacterium]